MKIRLLEMRNYRRHRHTVIEWPDGVTAALGRNGAGKSTILESIGFALFGVAATRTGKDLLKWDGAGPMDSVRVSLEFELGGQGIRLTRELRGKALTPQATLMIDGAVAVDSGAGSNEAVTTEIERLLGMDRETFFTTIVANQGDLDRLASLTPARRKQLLLGMLGIDSIDRAIERARGRRREEETRVEALRDALPNITALQEKEAAAKQALAEANQTAKVAHESWTNHKRDLESVSTDLAALEKAAQARFEVEAKLKDATRQQEQTGADVERLQVQHDQGVAAASRSAELAPVADQVDALRASVAAAQRHEEIRQQSNSIEQSLRELPDDLPSIEVANQRAQHAAASLDGARDALAAAKATHDHAARHARKMDDLGHAADCPTCERPLAGYLPSIQAKLRAELGELEGSLHTAEAHASKAQAEATETAEHARGAQQHAELRTKLAELKTQLSAASQIPLEQLRHQLGAAEAARDECLRIKHQVEALPALKQSLAAATQRRGENDATVKGLQATLADLPDHAAALAALRTKHATHVEAERDGERQFLAQQANQNLAQKQLEHAQTRIADAAALTKKLEAAEMDARYWAALAGGRGKGMLEAFKANLVGRIGPAIGREASRLLTRFTGGRYTEILLDAEYNVFVSDGGKSYALERFSGGESDLVHLALRLAVSRLLVERSNSDIRFLALDEVFGSLDSERRELVLAALQELGSLYSQVLLVTHHDSLKDALDASMVVEEINGEAAVVVHAG